MTSSRLLRSVSVLGFCLAVALAGGAHAAPPMPKEGAPPPPVIPGGDPPDAAGSAHHRAAAAFAPWDAGASRPVARQGTAGLPRRAHPMVGDAAKVPGEGIPAPPQRLDSDIPELALQTPNAAGNGLSSNPLLLASLIYAHYLTKVDDARCQHMPTCSRFAAQAVARHGVVGVLMGLDRISQPNQSSAVRLLPEVSGYGQARGFDPIENYEFWHTERFTGFPPLTAEQPLELAPVARAPAPSSATTSPADAPTPTR